MASLEVSVQKQLRGFSLDVAFRAGERGCLGILGASGCGKSMTLRSIAGIETPDEGRIALGERVLFDSRRKIDLPPQKRRVGYLFQSCALFPNMTVEENIAAGLRDRPKSERPAIVAHMVQKFRLAGLEDRYPRQLSGGQQQRVALGRILACDPEVLLLDEPFSALDAFLREELLLELNQTLADYRGVSILVTHSREEAFRLCGEILVMSEGRRSAFGETKALFRSPGTVQAARLTGCRNIARAERGEGNTLRVPEWNAVLEPGRPIPEGTTHVGVRSRSLHPAGAGEGNRISLTAPTVLEDPARSQVVFAPAGDGECRLWWEPEGDVSPGTLPRELAVAPEDILLLTE